MDTLTTLVFYAFSFLTLGSAVYLVATQNVVRAAFALLFTFFGVAGLYVILGADFVAGAQVLIYVGGILVLLLFGVMMTRKVFEADVLAAPRQSLPAALVCLGAFLLIARGAWTVAWPVAAGSPAPRTTAAIGELLMGDYLLPFEVASILLLVALVGAVSVARRGVKGTGGGTR